jgi:hypothetical protein
MLFQAPAVPPHTPHLVSRLHTVQVLRPTHATVCHHQRHGRVPVQKLWLLPGSAQRLRQHPGPAGNQLVSRGGAWVILCLVPALQELLGEGCFQRACQVLAGEKEVVHGSEGGVGCRVGQPQHCWLRRLCVGLVLVMMCVVERPL